MPAALPLALFGAQLVLVAADGPPRLDIAATCNSPGRASVSQEAGSDGCLRSERSAGDELRQRWGQFSGPAKTQCSQQSRAGGFPSYVEMLTCLELATGSVPVTSPTNRATAGQGSPATTGSVRGRPEERADSMTAEPSASQRTDPLKVLGKPAK